MVVLERGGAMVGRWGDAEGGQDYPDVPVPPASSISFEIDTQFDVFMKSYSTENEHLVFCLL